MTPAESLVSDGLVSVRAACAFLNLSRTKLWAMMDAGQIPYVYADGFGNASRRIPRKALVAWAASRLLGPLAP